MFYVITKVFQNINSYKFGAKNFVITIFDIIFANKYWTTIYTNRI